MKRTQEARYVVAEGPQAKRAYLRLSPLARQILDVVFDYPTVEQLERGRITEGGQGAVIDLIYWLIERIEGIGRDAVTRPVADRFILAIIECQKGKFLSMGS
jgi:hypothetical protein